MGAKQDVAGHESRLGCDAIAHPLRSHARVSGNIWGDDCVPMIRRLWALRWWMISLITIGTILNYLTRATLGVAAPTLTGELGITEKEYSWITGLFQLGIMLQP